MTPLVDSVPALATGGERVRVAHVVTHPIPYFIPLYRELSARPEIDLTVIYLSTWTAAPYFDRGFGRSIDWSTSLLDGYTWKETSPQHGPGRGVRLDVVREVLSGRYDAIWIHGYNHAHTWLTAALATVRKIPVLIREEAVLERERSLHRRVVKELPLRLMFRVTSGLFIGTRNRAFFERYGMPAARLHHAPYCVDNGELSAAALRLAGRRDELRASLGITDDAPAILFVGKLYAGKCPDVLLEAFAQVRDRQRCWLVFVGDGELRASLENAVRITGTPGVLFAGFRSGEELHEAYAACDIHVLPSRAETWGLVVNEAMNFGLPVIVSDNVGCGPDLVIEEQTGFRVPPGDVRGLADALGRLVTDQALRARLGAQAQALVATHSVERCADGIVAAVLATTRRTP